MVELRQLTSFVETARAGTYAAAAERLHLAQPAVWKHVRTLETDLGVALFERVGRRVRLTPSGLLLLERAEQLLDGADRVRDLASDLQAGRAGTVTIGCLAPHVVGFLAPVIGAYHRAHPRVRVALREVELAPPQDAASAFAVALHSGAVDLVTGPAVPGADSLHIYDVSVVCAVPARHRWRNQPSISVQQLRGTPLLTSPEGYFSRAALDRACRAAGFEPVIEIESANPTVLIELGRQGLGLPVMASDAVLAPSRPWPVVDDENGPLTSAVWLSSRRPQAPVVTAFVELARDTAATP